MCKSLLGFDGEKKWASTLQTTRERNSIDVHIYIYIYICTIFGLTNRGPGHWEKRILVLKVTPSKFLKTSILEQMFFER